MSLINTAESLNLDWKETYNFNSKLSILKDIVSLANASGGYIIVGIREDVGKNLSYVPLTSQHAESLRCMIRDVCNDHIEERIDGLEISQRDVSGCLLLLIRVPQSARAPHMITFENRTLFFKRFQDGNREMSLSEIRRAFNEDFTSSKLASLEMLMRRVNSLPNEQILERRDWGDITDGKTLSRHAREHFERLFGVIPSFYMSAVPAHSIESTLDFEKIRSLFLQPSGSRYGGWNMSLPSDFRANSAELIRGEEKNCQLTLMNNGLLEFQADLVSLFCFGQIRQEPVALPRLYPYPVVEIPVTFLRLYSEISTVLNLNECDVIINLEFYNLRGFALTPDRPGAPGFDSQNAISKPYEDRILLITRKVKSLENTDFLAYEILKELYAAFRFSEQRIPFFIDKEKIFKFD